MPEYGQTQRTPAQKSDGGASEHRTAARDHAGAEDALGAALNESPRSRSLMQLRAALDASPRVQALQGLEGALNRSPPKGHSAGPIVQRASVKTQPKEVEGGGRGEERGFESCRKTSESLTDSWRDETSASFRGFAVQAHISHNANHASGQVGCASF
jgi:hypothetical protein